MMEMSPLLTSPIMFWRRNLIASKSEICRPTFPPLPKSWFINVVFNIKSGIAMNHVEGHQTLGGGCCALMALWAKERHADMIYVYIAVNGTSPI